MNNRCLICNENPKEGEPMLYGLYHYQCYNQDLKNTLERIATRYTKQQTTIKQDFTILFLGSIKNPSDFYPKGGLEAIRVLEQLQEDYKVKLIIKYKVPYFIKRRIKKNPDITLIEGRISDEEMEELYEKADVLLSPNQTYVLMSVLEALSHGLPVIAYDTYAVRDILSGFQANLIVDPPEECKEIYEHESYPLNIRTSKSLKLIKAEHPKAIERLCSKVKLLMPSSFKK